LSWKGSTDELPDLQPHDVAKVVVPGTVADSASVELQPASLDQNAKRRRLRKKCKADGTAGGTVALEPRPAVAVPDVAARSAEVGDTTKPVEPAKRVRNRKRVRASRAAALDEDKPDAPATTDDKGGDAEEADEDKKQEMACKKNKRRREQAQFAKPAALEIRERPQDHAGSFNSYKKSLQQGVKSLLGHFKVEQNPNGKLQLFKSSILGRRIASRSLLPKSKAWILEVPHLDFASD